MAGICSFGGYIPRYRLNRGVIYQAMGWMNPANIANAGGEKAVANFDEDAITMAVAAGLNALKGFDRSAIEGVYMASTSMPYKERLNTGIVSTALGLDDHIRTADFSGGLKSGTTALLAALDAVAAKSLKNIVASGQDFVSQVKGLFNIGYERPVAQKAVQASSVGSVGAAGGWPFLLVIAYILWVA